MAWQTPKTDWTSNPKSPMAGDFNRIEGNIEHLLAEIETKKGAIVAALNNVGMASTIEDSYSDLANKINTAKKTGIVITPTTVDQAIPKGIFDTSGGKVLGDPDLISENIRKGKNIFGVEGQSTVLQTSSGTGALVRVSDTVARLTVTGLSFKPSKVFVRGSVRAKYGQSFSGSWYDEYLDFDFGIVDGFLRPNQKMGILSVSGGISWGSAILSCTVTYNNNGFVALITGNDTIEVVSGSGGTQYWFAQEG